ncbi:biotin--[acetyl-CoA-carboxylase] ligase [Maribacter sp. 2304DJ31-5]|uniref:biotin--[acetyl-CoA-carboxylase] ligase n=1 Tax=Maribacter sp. 2304DJ31-5 TaxID=3386273 RepID=UPI0039BC3731
MQLIKLDATESTNSYLKGLLGHDELGDFTVVLTDNQTKGRGQINASWSSEPGKNLTFSVLKFFNGIGPQHQFLINVCVSLAIYDALAAVGVPRLSIKWPNDILSGASKICGILIENLISGQEIKSTIIGIGLNVNQTVFSKGLNASSIKLQLGMEVNKEELLELILSMLKESLSQVDVHQWKSLYERYQKEMFRKDMPSTFQKPDGSFFTGIIQGITQNGMLKIHLENDERLEFNFKEVKLLY